jgi:hypothetical protein
MAAPGTACRRTLAFPTRHCWHATATDRRFLLFSVLERRCPGSSVAGAMVCHRSKCSILCLARVENEITLLKSAMSRLGPTLGTALLSHDCFVETSGNTRTLDTSDHDFVKKKDPCFFRSSDRMRLLSRRLLID